MSLQIAVTTALNQTNSGNVITLVTNRTAKGRSVLTGCLSIKALEHAGEKSDCEDANIKSAEERRDDASTW